MSNVNENTENKHKGLRFDDGKLRYDLVHPWAHEQMVSVLTKGSLKYAARNWEKGMKWSKVIASLKRHIACIEKGEDYDFYPDTCEDCKNGNCKNHTGELHAAQVACNAHFLTAYYKIYPQGDDRPHGYLNDVKIGLDIDEVLCGWVKAWSEKFGYENIKTWNFSYDNYDHFKSFSEEEIKEFYLSIPRIMEPDELPFEPHCYITSRSIPIEITKQWLQMNGFPTVPVYSVGFGESKVEVAKASGIDIFVDDCYKNFVELNKAGVCTFLWDTPHNERYNVGYRRIKSLKELI